jgi:hypothetical protein
MNVRPRSHRPHARAVALAAAVSVPGWSVALLAAALAIVAALQLR